MKKNKINILTIFFKGLILILFLIPIFLLSSCDNPVSKSEIINNLFPNLWVFIAHIIGSIVLMIAIFLLLWKPIKKSLNKRYEYITKQLNDAKKNKELAMIEMQEANQLKINAISHAMEITTSAQTNAFNIIENANQEAKKNSEKILNDAKNEIKKAKINAEIDAKNNIINIAFDVASSILKKEIDKNNNNQYIDEILNSINKEIKKDK